MRATNKARTAIGVPTSRIPSGAGSANTAAGRMPDATQWDGSSWPFRADDISPLAWWRTLPADLLGDAQHLLLRDTLGKIGVLDSCEWLAAMRGDVTASIAIAREILPIGEVTLEVDLAMTVLTTNPLGGSARAALVLSEALRRTPLDHPFAGELSVSWLVLNLRRALEAGQHRLPPPSPADACGRGRHGPPDARQGGRP
ncbi:MAG: hypothetical protein ACLP1D_10860 [Xanthobacteraceae bacterium]